MSEVRLKILRSAGSNSSYSLDVRTEIDTLLLRGKSAYGLLETTETLVDGADVTARLEDNLELYTGLALLNARVQESAERFVAGRSEPLTNAETLTAIGMQHRVGMDLGFHQERVRRAQQAFLELLKIVFDVFRDDPRLRQFHQQLASNPFLLQMAGRAKPVTDIDDTNSLPS